MRIKVLLILLVAFELTAGELKSPEAQRIAEQMSQAIAQKVQEITAHEKALGIENVQIHLSQSQQFNSGRFGTLLSANSPGLVISVTPNSQASHLGIKDGDQITAVNGVDINDVENTQSALSVLQYAQDSTAVEIVIKRQDELITLSGILTAKLLPSWTFNTDERATVNVVSKLARAHEGFKETQVCGQIKLGERIEYGRATLGALAGKSLRTRALKTVVVVAAIDGIKVENPLQQKFLKIPTGYHTLKVYRRIHHFDENRAESAEYRIRIDANTTYSLAYRSDTMLSNVHTQKYAELPVIWKAKKQACQM